MSHPLRQLTPGQVQFITVNTERREFLLTPYLHHSTAGRRLSRRQRRALDRTPASPEINNILGACLARANARYPVNLIAFQAMATHCHLEHCDDKGNQPFFMSLFLSLSAREINRHLGREGKVWARRHSSSACLGDEVQIEKFAYLHANPCRAHLVDHAADWPGLSTVHAVTQGAPLRFWYHDRTAFHRARHRGEQVTLDDFRRDITLELVTLPCWQDLPVAEQRRRAAEAIRIAEDEARKTRLAEKKSVMPLDVLLAQQPTQRPSQPLARTPRPLCHASDQETYFAFRDQYREFCREYHAASFAFRGGDLGVVFPKYSIPPSLLYRTTE